MLETMLSIQELDTTLDQLSHRRAALPERVALQEVTEEVAQLTTALAARQADRDGLAREEKRLEDEAATVEEKVHDHEQAMYATTSPKELVAMQHEVESLRLRQRALEDEAIELMEQIEPVDAELVAGAAKLEALARRAAELDRALIVGEAEVDAEVEQVAAERASIAAGIDDDLLATYETLRGQLGGVAVARFDGQRCGGCHLALSAVESDRIRHAPADDVVRCPECTRLLVR